jgi:hypothetical protein
MRVIVSMPTPLIFSISTAIFFIMSDIAPPMLGWLANSEAMPDCRCPNDNWLSRQRRRDQGASRVILAQLSASLEVTTLPCVVEYPVSRSGRVT